MQYPGDARKRERKVKESGERVGLRELARERANRRERVRVWCACDGVGVLMGRKM
jgi:hypothetical protein